MHDQPDMMHASRVATKHLWQAECCPQNDFFLPTCLTAAGTFHRCCKVFLHVQSGVTKKQKIIIAELICLRKNTGYSDTFGIIREIYNSDRCND